MATTRIEVIINGRGQIQGLNQVSKGLDDITQRARKSQESINKAVKIDFTQSIPGLNTLKSGIGGITDAFGTLKNVAIGGALGAAFVGGVNKAIDASVRLENSLIGVSSVAKATGNDVDEVTSAVQSLAADGLIPVSDVANTIKMLLASGLGLNESIKLFNALKDSAAFNRAGFLSLGEAVRSAAEGIKNGNSILVDNAGITKNLSILQREYAESIGTTAGKLTDAQKIQAAYLGVLRESANFTGDAAKLSGTYTGAISRLNAGFDRFLAALGNTITQSSITTNILNKLGGTFNSLAESFADPTIARQIEEINKKLANVDRNNLGEAYRKTLQGQLVELEKQLEAEKKLKSENSARLGAQRDEQAKIKAAQEEATRANTQRLKDIEKLDKALKSAGETELATLRRVRDERLKLVGDDAARRLRIEQDFAQKASEINKKLNAERIRDANETAKRLEEITSKALIAAANARFRTVQEPANLNDEERRTFERNTAIGRGVGVLNAVAGGAEGAGQLVTGIAGLALDAFVPGLGQAAQPLLDLFAQGPEATKAAVKAFTDALPTVIEGFVEAIPVFVETLADQAPVIIERLAEKAPAIISKLVESAPKIGIALASVMPQVAIKFTTELIKNVPRIITEAVNQLAQGIKQIFEDLTTVSDNSVVGQIGGFLEGALGGVGGAVGNIVGAVGDVFGFANGGEVRRVAGAAPFRDSVNAKVQSGELILDRSTSNELKRQLQNGGNLNDSSQLASELRAIRQLLSAPMNVQSDVRLNQEAFARIILNLTRTNQRLA